MGGISQQCSIYSKLRQHCHIEYMPSDASRKLIPRRHKQHLSVPTVNGDALSAA